MSAVAAFLRLQYQLGRVTAQQVQGLVGHSITPAEAEEILTTGKAER